ncbi:MAG TPA: TIGR03619 family F420-dependent LLM class oxidoreductase [Acidimicrobiia bacterium]|nr:TIGR03619 family F420-dependent LLM class oxidoreductase [Acidimicrobiia bacterium]
MRAGIVTPVLTALPRAHARWELDAGIAEVERIVVEAERLGYHHVTCSEHVAIPHDVAATRGATYWDPLATFSYLAARTSTIHLATFVLVIGYHHPLEIVKRYGTLDRISGGRLVLGLGVGSLEPEFALLGAEFDDRGARADDAIRALRACWGVERPDYHGSHHDIDGFVVRPTAGRIDVPIWIGGRSRRSLRRAVELGDGWAPFGMSNDEVGAALADARATDAWAARSVPLDVGLQPEPLDPSSDPDGARMAIDAARAAGATTLNLRFVHHSVDHYCEQLDAMRALLGD